MKAMVLREISDLESGGTPLEYSTVPDPAPKEKEILIRVSVCGVCHTELDEIEGRMLPPALPVIPGHQVVGRVERNGSGARKFHVGDRVGVAWIFWACGVCNYCREGNENLCEQFRATGRDSNGGYAELMTVHEDFACPIPPIFSDVEAAPHLCAGAIGFRSLQLSGIGEGQHLGLTGFGASGHLVLKLAKHRFPGTRIYVFARSAQERGFAMELGADWAGDTGDRSPAPLHAIIDTTPVWKSVVGALKNLRPGGRLVINAIRKEDADKDAFLLLDYARDLWMEKETKSVANVTRKDVTEFLTAAAAIPIRPEVREYPLKDANAALREMKKGQIRGAKVLRIG